MLLAFDIGGTFIKYALVDEAYQLLLRNSGKLLSA